VLLFVFSSAPPFRLTAQALSQADADGGSLTGHVLDKQGKAVGGAQVKLGSQNGSTVADILSDAVGDFRFERLPKGEYVISASTAEMASQPHRVTPSREVAQDVRLVLLTSADRPAEASSKASPPGSAFSFSDQPSFSVAGVTDWTAVGGHGSDATLRTSEDLNREILALKANAGGSLSAKGSQPEAKGNRDEGQVVRAQAAAPHSASANRDLGLFYLSSKQYQQAIPPLQMAYELDRQKPEDAYHLALAERGDGKLTQAQQVVAGALKRENAADLRRLSGELDEALGDPVHAVQEEEQATRLDPSEENYFTWGSELLMHRAIWQAAQIFADGVHAHPRSARLKTALGAALFSEARYDQAAQTLCDASDLEPAYREPYLFMGKAALASPEPLPCVQQKLERFLYMQPNDAEANYFYAMVLLRQVLPPDRSRAKILLEKAVALNPRLAEGYLQLGILALNQHSYPEAIALLSKAVQADPKQSEAHYRLGVIYDRLNQREKAKAEFRQHGEIDAANAALVEQQRREIKQFLVVLNGPSAATTSP